MFEIRYATPDEIESLDWPTLWDEANEGADILVAEASGQIRAWAQFTGSTIYFIESVGGGAGTALVNYLKEQVGYLVADNVKGDAAGYWEMMGFRPIPTQFGRGPRNSWDWEEENV